MMGERSEKNGVKAHDNDPRQGKSVSCAHTAKQRYAAGRASDYDVESRARSGCK